MAVGQGSYEGYASYLAVGRETTFGTYNTASAALCFQSANMKTMQESKTLEQVCTNRTYSKSIRLGKIIEGEIAGYAFAGDNSFNYILQNAMGGTITSATATGETAGGAAFTHTYAIGDMNNSYTSLCLNMRKGQSSGGFVFEYSGVRVNELTFTAELDEALKFSAAVMGKDSTNTSNDVASVLTESTDEPLVFSSGRVSVVAGTLGAVTTTAFWHVQSVEFGLTNALKSEAEARRIGSDTVDVMPVGVATMPLTLNMRFDTTTAYDGMLANTDFAVELEFEGSTLSTSVIKRGVKFKYPVTKISDAGDPEIGGPDGVLTSAVVMNVLRDTSSAGGYALEVEVTNDTSSYA